MASRKKTRAKLRRNFTIKASAAVLALLMMGTWVYETFKGEIIDMINADNLRDNVKVESYEPTYGDTDSTRPTEGYIEIPDGYDRDYPSIIPDFDGERISSELLDSGFNFEPVDFNQLNEINSDTVAWMSIPGTSVDYPIVQGESNDKYMKKSFEGYSSASGSIFLDYRNNTLESPENDLSDISLVYGHHMSGGKMFAPICNYKSQKFYDNHPFGIVYTEDGLAYKVEFFAGVIIDGTDETVLFTSDFVDAEEYETYLDNIRINSTFDSDVEIEYGDKVIALVTCSYETNNSRYVLYGKLGKQIINESQRDLVNVEQGRSLN